MRCIHCRLHLEDCICALMPRLQTRTRVILLIHRREDAKSTNTGRLALRCLSNSELYVRGLPGRPDAPIAFPRDSQPLLLFPSTDAEPIERWCNSRAPVALVVPDGTWRQAARMPARVPGLRDLPRVTLAAGEPTRYRLRTEVRPGGLATMEAIARALGALEGEHVRAALERVFDAMVERTLHSRGALERG